LIGDSHANRLYDLLQQGLSEKGGVLLLGEGGCAPLRGAQTRRGKGQEYCYAAMQQIFAYIIAQPEIRRVLLVSRGPYYITGGEFGEGWGRHGGVRPAYEHVLGAKTFARELAATVAQLHKAGKEVMVILDNPEFAFHPLRCIEARPGVRLRAVEATCRYPRAAMEERNRDYVESVRRVPSELPGVRVVNLLETFCDARYCYGMRDGKLLYMDSDHLSQHGARVAVDAIIANLFGQAL
jgi:hypothetical protein